MNNPKTLPEWLALLETRSAAHRVVLGLERVRAVWSQLSGNAPFPHRVVTVAGTNGKGSTCAFLEAIAAAAGWRVGCYTSPHLLRYHERVRLNQREVGDELLVSAFAAVEAARGDLPLTYFEFGTVAALWCFIQTPLDLVILEVGMGGRLDAVNILDADVAVITPIALDHQAYLGNDRESIGREKAGIMRPLRPAVVSDPDPPDSVLETARLLSVPLYRLGVDFGYERGSSDRWRWWRGEPREELELPLPGLRGVGQVANASAAILALKLLGVPLTLSMIEKGLLSATLPGRFQVLPGSPPIILDVAHNPHAARTLAENLKGLKPPLPLVAVMGCYADKESEGMIAPLAPMVDEWIFVPTEGARGQSAEVLAQKAVAGGAERVTVAPSVGAALDCLVSRGQADVRIVIYGSFSVVGQALEWDTKRQEAKTSA
ncbi:MAG: bifunctional tetrahydrofolate synthase/dihydrofolate synthase [Hydrogenophilus sp.]|nr:bifunctional tetrahydrofolate synthase/dihydrofolate synthase [Hydrogenophilus sp.]